MKTGMKVDMGIADEMSLMVLGSRSTLNYAQSAPEPTYSQFMMARCEGLQ